MYPESNLARHITIVQWNCRSIKGKKTNLQSLLLKTSADIFILCETWLSPKDFFNFKNFQCIRIDRDTRAGGVLILVKRGWSFSTISFSDLATVNINNIDDSKDILKTVEIAGIVIDHNNFKCSIVSSYIPPRSKLNSNELEQLFNQIPQPMILAGDLNAHNTAWGCINDDRLGLELEKSLNNLDLVFLNDGSVTRLAPPPFKNSALDLTICSKNLGLNCSWSTLSHYLGDSDHVPTVTVLNFPNFSPNNDESVLSFSDVNWKYFQANICPMLVNMNFNGNIDEYYEELMKAINTSAKNSKANNNNGKNNLESYWWDDDCDSEFEKRKSAFKAYRSSYSRESFDFYILTLKQTKQFFKEKKKLAWLKFCESVSSDRSLQSFWKMAKHFNNKSNTPGVSFSNDDWMEEFANKLAPPFVPVKPPILEDIAPEGENLVEVFSMDEMSFALDNTKNSSAGMDNISYKSIKRFPIELKQKILEIFNIIHDSGITPRVWKKCKVVAIPKPGKPSHLASSYRGINLLICFRKLFEKMLHFRLEAWFEQRSIFPNNMFGFRRGLGTADCLNQLISDAYISLDKKETLAAVFLDISAAFDNVKIDLLCEKLKTLLVPDKTIKMIWELMSERELNFYWNNKHYLTKNSFLGVPQGSILSPIMFNVYTIDLCNLVGNCKFIQYADDITFYVSSNKNVYLENSLQEVCNRVEQWSMDTGLEISGEKSHVIPFTRKHKKPELEVILNNNIIPLVDSLKYLGVVLDRKLRWQAQALQQVTRSRKAINAIKMISGTPWGNDPRSLLVLYKAFIRSVIEYCPLAILNMSNCHFIKIERLQWGSLRIALGCMNSSPNSSLEVLAGIPPLRYRLKFLLQKFMIKIFLRNFHYLKELWYDLRHLNICPVLVVS